MIARIGRALGVVAVWVAVLEVTLRLVYLSDVVSDRIFWKFGSDSNRLGFYYHPRACHGVPCFAWDPELGWVNLPGRDEELGLPVTVNELGFRETGVRPRRVDDRTRVMIVGDSFSFGSEASDAWWYGAVLPTLAPVELVVASVPGHGLDQSLLRMRREMPVWDPDVVVLAVTSVMADRTMWDFQTGPKPVIFAEGGDLTPVNLPLPTVEDARAQIRWSSHGLLTARMLRWRAFMATKGYGVLREARANALLAAFAEEVRASGREVLLAWFPLDADAHLYVERRRPQDFGGFACPPHVPCVDLTPDLAAVLEAGLPIDSGAHWSEPASAAIARGLARELQGRGLVP